ncbi:MAG: hypothetical protein AAGA57_03075, partial [Planctomycetota bacterium]
SAIRDGRHKLIVFHQSKRSLLFDLNQDPGEERDLAPQMPERARELQRTLEAYLLGVAAERPQQSVTWKVGDSGAATTRFLDALPAGERPRTLDRHDQPVSPQGAPRLTPE